MCWGRKWSLVICHLSLGIGKGVIDVSGLVSGVYFVEVYVLGRGTNNEGRVVRKKIVKE